MDLKKGKFSVTLFDPDRDNLKDLVKFDEKANKGGRNFFNIVDVMSLYIINPNIFHILIDNYGKIHGYSILIPVIDSLFDKIMIEKLDIFSALRKEYIFSIEQAKMVSQKKGNSLIVYISTYDCENETQNVHIALPLLMNLELLYYKYRLRQLITRGDNNENRVIIEDSGCIRLFDLPEGEGETSSVYYFGLNQAINRPTTGLGVVMIRIWGVPGHEKQFLLKLTENEKMALKLLIDGYTYKEAAYTLSIKLDAFEARMKRIDKKAILLGLTDRKRIRSFIIKHPQYYF